MGWLKERVERVNIAAVTEAVTATAAKLPMGLLLLQGFEWVYERALAGAPGLNGATELATSYRTRHGSEEAAIDALILYQSGAASVAGFVQASAARSPCRSRCRRISPARSISRCG